MGAEDTPPEAMPTRGDHGPTDAGWFREWRRDLSNTLRDLATRLVGIDSRLAQGSATLDKHADQIGELAAADAELHQRVEKLERDGSSGLVRRIAAVEGDLAPIAKDFAEQQAVAKAAERSAWRRLLARALDGAADKAGTIIVLAIAGLIAASLRAQTLALAGLRQGDPVPAKVEPAQVAPPAKVAP